ncbi:hypothetical protein [Aureimonas psammosilenae]|uniref:hypothetical protein n=1 Tax=Aureimonas psammosilenae TaxID=2495496 RepID=UPI0012606CA3|nr:hypothetical protein [Aureimonas psammosilenae]
MASVTSTESAVSDAEAMGEVVGEAAYYTRLLDYLLADNFGTREGGFYRVPEGSADLIMFVSGKALDAARLCEGKLLELNARVSAESVK